MEFGEHTPTHNGAVYAPKQHYHFTTTDNLGLIPITTRTHTQTSLYDLPIAMSATE